MIGSPETPSNRTRIIQRGSLGAILLLSTFLHSFRLHQVGTNGLGSPYYAAAVQSMLTSWRHFFYLAFDPAGFLALDKAPLTYWIQAASARVFGFHGLSLLLPQALAGVLSVYVLFRLVRCAYGHWAGLLAALALAVTPISVVIDRTNHPDPLLVLVLLLAAGAVTRAVGPGSLRWLLLGAVLVGVAFNVKMLQILLVLPALAALYLFGSSLPWRRRFQHAALAMLLAVLVALPWVLAVELTPPERRPYVGGSSTNGVFELILGYNGIERLWGEDWSAFIGTPGPFRFFSENLAGQVSWLLPFALVGLLAAVWRLRRDTGPAGRRSRQQALILWSAWLIFPLLYFSVSTFYHRYYLATMAPAIAALVGIGADALWSLWHSSGWRRWAIALALPGCAGVQALILWPHAAWSRWLIPPISVLVLTAIAMLVVAWRAEHRGVSRWPQVAFVGGILTLLIAPAVWATIPVVTCTSTTLPVAGPQAVECEPFEVKPFLDPELVIYLEGQRQGARYLAATYDLGIACLGILETEQPFMAMGGYRGSDPILTVDEFAQLVATGEVRFFLTLTRGSEEYPQQEEIRQWVRDHCPLSPVQSQGVEVRGPCVVGE